MQWLYVDDWYVNNRRVFKYKDSAGMSREFMSDEIKSLMRKGDKFEHVRVTTDNKLIFNESIQVTQLKRKVVAPQVPSTDNIRIDTGVDIQGQMNAVMRNVLKERDFVVDLYKTVQTMPLQKVSVLFGIRATGKTVGMWQCIQRLRKAGVSDDKIAFVDCSLTQKVSTLQDAVDTLYKKGVLYVFIDEVSGIEGILNHLAIFANAYAGKMSIVMTGTDSFVFAEAFGDRLFHRHVTFPLAFMGFREYERLTGGDTESAMKKSGVFNDELSTADKLRDGIQTAIINNIVRSVTKNKDYFLRDKYSVESCQEVAGVFNRLDDMNLMYLTTSILLDAVRPKEDKCVGGIKELVTDMKALAAFINMTGSRFREKSSYTALLNNTVKTYKKKDIFVIRECLNRLGIISVLPNVLQFVHDVDIQRAESEIVCMIPAMYYTMHRLYNRSAAVGDLFENYALSQAVGLLNTYVGCFDVGFARFVDLSMKNRGPREIDLVIRDLNADRTILVEIKNTNSTGGLAKHLLAPMTDSLFPSAEKVVCYNGVNDNIGGVKYLNIKSFVDYVAAGCK